MGAFAYLTIALVSISLSMLETHDVFRVNNKNFTSDLHNITNIELLLHHSTPHPTLKLLNGLCTIVFISDIIIRFIVWPQRALFFKNIFNVCDLLAIFFVITHLLINKYEFEQKIKVPPQVRIILIVYSTSFRISRILHSARHNRELRLMYLAIRATLGNLFLLVGLLTTMALLFAILVYAVESYTKEGQFTDISQGMWWGVITMSTIGYGDVVPITTAGFMVGGLCALTGVILTGLAVPLLASNFMEYHDCAGHTQKKETTLKWRKNQVRTKDK